MARRKRRKINQYYRGEDSEIEPALSSETKRGILIVFLFVFAFLTIFSIFNLAGTLGQYIKNLLGNFFGWGSYLLPLILIILAYFLLKPEKYEIKPSNYLGLILFIFSYLGILQIIKDFNQPTVFSPPSGGGYLGFVVIYPLSKFMGPLATVLMMIALLIVALLITFNTGLAALFSKINPWHKLREKIAEAEEEYEQAQLDEEAVTAEAEATTDDGWLKAKVGEETENKKVDEEIPAEEIISEERQVLLAKKKMESSTAKISKKIALDLKITFAKSLGRIIQVPLSLLDSKTSKPTSGDIKANLEKIKATLENFGIAVTMGEVNVGPTITQFTLKPTEGVKLANITSLQNDIALALAAHPIRIEAPIPGKSLVGIEVPNQSIATVKLKEIIEDDSFKKKKWGLAAALGKDVSGKIWTIDLTNLPHLLIAGATGSGKSVCINSIIVSLLFQNSPEQLRFILIDPKRVELTAYNGLPHLLTPVITDVNKTINALRWAVREMDERYKLLEATNKRNIAAYNASVLTNRLPYIVIIIDELADLMAVAPKEIENAIVRLAQMARAVGLHLMVATQRPSVNIITGLIKANITSRIAFAVASSVDSRTILDFGGAEKLLGKGDMLYISAELSKPKRLQGSLVTDEEIERVADFWRGQAEPNYLEEVTEKQTKVNLASGAMIDEDGDELLEEAKEIILTAGKASASFLQRRLRIGYARAARLLDLLEEQGIIGPADGAKPREILVDDRFYKEQILSKDEKLEDEFAEEVEAAEQAEEDLKTNRAEDEARAEPDKEAEESKDSHKIKIHYKNNNNF